MSNDIEARLAEILARRIASPEQFKIVSPYLGLHRPTSGHSV